MDVDLDQISVPTPVECPRCVISMVKMDGWWTGDGEGVPPTMGVRFVCVAGHVFEMRMVTRGVEVDVSVWA